MWCTSAYLFVYGHSRKHLHETNINQIGTSYLMQILLLSYKLRPCQDKLVTVKYIVNPGLLFVSESSIPR